MSEYSPISFKYLTGWGDVDLSTPQAAHAATVEEVLKTLKKFSAKEKSYFKDKWRQAYKFYAGVLLDEADAELAGNDEYLQKIEKELE